MEVAELHGILWRLIEADGLEIRHNARSTQPDPLESGFFHPVLVG